jgi:hypothetical protein
LEARSSKKQLLFFGMSRIGEGWKAGWELAASNIKTRKARSFGATGFGF